MIFLRNEMLLGTEAVNKLKNSHVAVVGLGGVGSWAAEALARSGIGTLTLLDHDTVSMTNINRQLCALHSTVGKFKADVMSERVLDINPSINVFPRHLYYSADNRDEFFNTHYDYIIDAIDLVSCKIDLIHQAKDRNIPIISALGTGNKKDASLLRITDISKTTGCPLARVVRKELRRIGINTLPVVFSPEEGVTPLPLETPPEGRRSVPASIPWVPACAGILLASEVVMQLSGQR